MGNRGAAIAAIIAVLGSSLLSACTYVRDDLYKPGGVVGVQLDKHFFMAADDKKTQLLRATMITALASRVAVGTLKDGEDADAFLKRLGAVNRELAFLAADLDGTTERKNCLNKDAIVTDCDIGDVLFESNLPQLEYKISKMVVAALPQKEAAAFVRAVAGGNVLGAAWKFLRLADASLDGAHRGAAAYRSSLEILSMPCIAKLGGDSVGDRIKKIDQCLGLSDDKKIIKLQDVKDVEDVRFYAFFDMIRTSCMLLQITQDPDRGVAPAIERRNLCSEIKWSPQVRFELSAPFSTDSSPPAIPRG